MNRTKTCFWGPIASVLALSSAACGVQSLNSTGGHDAGGPTVTGVHPTPNQTIDAGGAPGSVFPLAVTSTGFVDDPVTGVIGNWFTFADGIGANSGPTTGADEQDSDCAKAGFPATDCSQVMTPTPGQPFTPTDPASSEMCTDGTAAQVLLAPGSSSPDYSALWGAGIGLNFNNPGGEFPAGYFDMTPYRGIAFDFTANVLPPEQMRVSLVFATMHGSDSPYWMGATLPYSPLTGTTASPQHVEIDWPAVGGPLYLTQQTPPVMPPPFDPTLVRAIEFQVFTNSLASTPYAFCVANLALVKSQ